MMTSALAIRRLAARVRVLGWLVAALSFALVAVSLIAGWGWKHRIPDDLQVKAFQAQHIRVVGSYGEKVLEAGSMSFDPSAGYLEIYGRGTTLVSAGASGCGMGRLCGAVGTFGPPQTRQAVLASGTDSGGTLSLFDKKGRLILKAQESEVGPGQLQLSDASGHTLLVAGGDSNGIGYLQTFDQKGRQLVELAAHEDGDGALTLFTEEEPKRPRNDAAFRSPRRPPR
jgi:hypothetical protein